MIKKYIIGLSILLSSMLSSSYINAAPVDSSCSTLCPTCPKTFLNYCRLCKYKDGILKAECQNSDKPAAFVTTSCPIVDGKLQCKSEPQNLTSKLQE